MEIPKTCIYCGKEYIAKTTHTRYCSHSCNRRDYKQQKRIQKINSLKELISPIKIEVDNKQYMSIPESARLLGVSERTIFRLLQKRIINRKRKGYKVLIPVGQLLKIKVYENID